MPRKQRTVANYYQCRSFFGGNQDHDESEDDNAIVIVHYILFIVRASTLRRMLRVTYICYCYMIMFYVGLAVMLARALLVNLRVFVRQLPR